METLTTIEIITFLISICIVAVANLFVLLDRIKKSDHQSVPSSIKKFAVIKNTFFVFGLALFLSSCSSGKFLSRKYTSGKFTPRTKTLLHNTVYTVKGESYASVGDHIELKKMSGFSNMCFEQEVIDTKVSSIIKKDSIFITQKKGKNIVSVAKNDLPDVTIIIRGNQKIIKQVKVVDQVKIKAAKDSKIKKFSKICLYLSFVPFLGFVFTITTRKIIKKYNKEYPGEKVNYNTSRINLALIISILTSIIGVIAFIYLFYLLFLANTMTAIY